VEQAIYEAAPDISGIVMEGFVEKTSTTGFVPPASLTTTAQQVVPESA